MDALAERVAGCDWYHTLELPGGIVTPGWFDCRAVVDRLPLPESLDGARVLEVGTWDGFWAFELERRGAAEVVAIDLDDPARWDWPPHLLAVDGTPHQQHLLKTFKAGGQGFAIAHEALGSRVQRRDVSVYELDPAVHGRFDFIFLGSLLLHLRDPVEALLRLHDVCAGTALIADAVEVIPSLLRPRTPTARLEGVDRPWWWQPNVAAFRQMLRSAGLEVLATVPLYVVPRGPGQPVGPLWHEWRRMLSAAGREELIVMARGVPHSAALVRPAETGGGALTALGCGPLTRPGTSLRSDIAGRSSR